MVLRTNELNRSFRFFHPYDGTCGEAVGLTLTVHKNIYALICSTHLDGYFRITIGDEWTHCQAMWCDGCQQNRF